MPARVVLRKRISVDAKVTGSTSAEDGAPIQQVVEARNTALDMVAGDQAQLTNDAADIIRNCASVMPNAVESEPQGGTPDATAGQRFLSTWGLALRQQPHLCPTVQKDSDLWVEGSAPAELRRRLLSREDVFTEISEKDGMGDLPTQTEVSDADKPAVGIDASVALADARQYWGTTTGGATFGTATDAMRLIAADDAKERPFVGSAGEDINVVIIDSGLNEGYLRSLVPDLNFGGGFVCRDHGSSEPGQHVGPGSLPSQHGNMIARNILRIAPRARIFDAAILPHRVTDIPVFTHDIEELYHAIADCRSHCAYADQNWILVNAWAVADNVQERGLGPKSLQFSTGDMHSTNILIQNMSKDFLIIFAAGNNGTYEPGAFAGIYNRGTHFPDGDAYSGRPFGGILGANALPGVLSVGACTVDGTWIGGSSEGDAPELLKHIAGENAETKPDLVAPSWFCEPRDCHQANTGTSAACAVTAGVAASYWSANVPLDPQTLRSELKDAAASPENYDQVQAYNLRYGRGFLNHPHRPLVS